ncbi:MAG: GcrA cell cycle regulator, partial [Alphaproteobacteria bacterium]|nr:GcrA cell cycle regulator [Alphaproteobacteria bacterium]
MSWTESRIEQLKTLWTRGLSASQIAEELGGVSRNAVIGKAHRLGLQGRPSPVKGSENEVAAETEATVAVELAP